MALLHSDIGDSWERPPIELHNHRCKVRGRIIQPPKKPTECKAELEEERKEAEAKRKYVRKGSMSTEA